MPTILPWNVSIEYCARWARINKIDNRQIELDNQLTCEHSVWCDDGGGGGGNDFECNVLIEIGTQLLQISQHSHIRQTFLKMNFFVLIIFLLVSIE